MLIKKTTLPSGLIILEATPAGGVPDPQDSLQPVLGPDEEALADSIDALNSSVSTLLASTAVAVATAAALTTLDNTTMNDGSLVWVEGRKRYFQLDKTSSAALLDGEVIATKSGAGRFVSLDATTSFTWQQQATWSIDPQNVNGLGASDDNDGSAAHPLLTFLELTRRWGPNPVLQQTTTVTVHSTPAATDQLRLFGVKSKSFDPGGNASLIIKAVVTIGAALPLVTAVSAINHAVADGALYVTAGAFVWPAAGTMLQIVGGLNDGARAFVAKPNTAAGQARLSPFMFLPSGSIAPSPAAIVTPLVGDQINVITPLLFSLPVHIEDSPITWSIEGFDFLDDAASTGQQINQNNDSSSTFTQCRFQDFIFCNGSQATNFIGCGLPSLFQVGQGQPVVIAGCCAVVGAGIIGAAQIGVDTIFDGGATYDTGTIPGATSLVGDFAVYDDALASEAAVTSQQGGRVLLQPVLGDTGTLYGTSVAGFTLVAKFMGLIGYAAAANVKLVGATALARVGGVNAGALPVALDAHMNAIVNQGAA